MDPLHSMTPQHEQVKRKTLGILPDNIETVASQIVLMEALAEVVPSLQICLSKAERECWPWVRSERITIQNAAQICGQDVNTILGITIMQNLNLEEIASEKLLMAWMALDYYTSILSNGSCTHMQALQEQIEVVIIARDFTETRPINPLPEQVHPDQHQEGQTEQLNTEDKHKTLRKIISAVAVIAVAAVLIPILLFRDVKEVEKAIDSIGPVTMESIDAIENAEIMYAALPEHKQEKVENRRVLEEARSEYDKIAESIRKVEESINKIGVITLKSEKNIDAARKAYDQLDEELRPYLQDELKILEQAEEKLQELKALDTYNQAEQYYNEGKYDDALAKYKTVIKDHPKDKHSQLSKTGARNSLLALAETAITENRLENAINYLQEVKKEYTTNDQYNDLLKKVEEKLEKNRPTNGKIFKNEIGWGWGEFVVKAGSQDAYVKLESTTDKNKHVTFYVRANESTTVKVKDGKYVAKYATGKYWYGEQDLFGSDTSYAKTDKIVNFSTEVSGAYVYYNEVSITLYSVAGGNMKTTDISSKDF